MNDCWEIKAVSKDLCSWNFAALCAYNWGAVLLLSVFCLAIHLLIKSAHYKFCAKHIFFQNDLISNFCAVFSINHHNTKYLLERWNFCNLFNFSLGERRGAISQSHFDDSRDAAAGFSGAVWAASPGSLLRWSGGNWDSDCLYTGWRGFRIYSLCSGSYAACRRTNCGTIGAGALENSVQRRWLLDLPKPKVWVFFFPSQKQPS